MRPQPHQGRAEPVTLLEPVPPEHPQEERDDLRQVLRRFNHRCRNSLSGLKMGLYLSQQEIKGPMPRCWIDLARTYGEIERLFDRLQVIYQPMSVSLVRSRLGHLITERLPSWRSWFSLKGQRLEADPPGEDVAGDFDPMYLGMGLDAFVGWRAKVGTPDAKPRLSWRIVSERFELSWKETCPTNGYPGVEPKSDLREQPRTSVCVHSLALVLLARIVAAHGGSLDTTSDPAFGIELAWPQFRDCGV
jgi:hypothetical protein